MLPESHSLYPVRECTWIQQRQVGIHPHQKTDIKVSPERRRCNRYVPTTWYTGYSAKQKRKQTGMAKKQTGDKKLPETEKNVTRMYPIYDIMDTTTGNSRPKKADTQNSLKPRKCNRYVSTV